MARALETRDNGAFKPTILIKNFIGGDERAAKTGETQPARSACDENDIVGIAPISTPDDVTSACRAAGATFGMWSSTPAPVRGQIIGRIGEALTLHKERLSRVICREIGKTMREARGEVQEAIDTAHFFQSEGRRLYG